VVDSTADAVDANPGDGVCANTAGACTLRAAVQEANTTVASAGKVEIHLAADAEYPLSLAGADEDQAATGDLDVHRRIVVHGGGAAVDAADIDRVFHVHGGGLLRLEEITITGGRARSGGGAEVEAAGRLELRDSTVADNEAPADYPGALLLFGGGGISNRGELVAVQSTITGNRASGTIDCPPPSWHVFCANGGGVMNWASASFAQVTFSGNEVVGGDASGGALATFGSSTVVSSTFVDNRAVVSSTTVVGNTFAGPVTITASALSGPVPLCDPPLQFANVAGTSGGQNVLTDASCPFTHPTDRLVPSVDLGPLTDNGGPTATHLPAAGSPLVDASQLCPGTEDQRHAPRPQGGACDVGAVESPHVAPPSVPLDLVVDDAADAVDVDPGDGACATAAGTCSLRAAIDETNANWPAVDHVAIAPGVDPVLSLAGPVDDLNATGDVDINGAVVITGGGAVVDAGGVGAALDVRANGGASVQIVDVVVTGGSAGGVRHAQGDLVLSDVGVSGNSSPGDGAGVHSADGTLTVASSTIRNNQTTGCCPRGGGLFADGSDVLVADSTVEVNVASRGAGIFATDATLTIERSTVRFNVATVGGGGVAVVRGDVDVVDASIVHNVVQIGHGGGLHLEDVVGASVLSSLIRGNEAEGPAPSLVTATGGGVAVDGGSLEIADTRIEHNAAERGGGVFNAGALTLRDSTVSENEATTDSGSAFGGGLSAEGGQTTIDATTFVENEATSGPAPRGGAIHVGAGGSLVLTRSTLDANRATGTFASAGSALSVANGNATVTGATITDNVSSAAAVERIIGSLTVAGTAVANPGPNCNGVTGSGGYNVVDDNTCGVVGPGDLPGVDPALGPLSDPDEPTPTRIPLAGAPVIDRIPAGTPALCDGSVPVDQRGLPRPVGSGCDSGAVERQPTDP
jgi:CSLREA domain-containing protein